MNQQQNRRRIGLIEKKYSEEGLTSEEEKELEGLQKLADEYADSLPGIDPKRLAELRDVYQRVEDGRFD